MILEDYDSGIQVAKISLELSELPNISSTYSSEHFKSIALDIYEYFQNKSDHAKFNRAVMLYEESKTEEGRNYAYQLLDDIIKDGWNSDSESSSLLPSYLTKLYFMSREWMMTIKSLAQYSLNL